MDGLASSKLPMNFHTAKQNMLIISVLRNNKYRDAEWLQDVYKG